MGAKLIEETVIRNVLVMFKKLNEQFLDSDEVLTEFYGANIPVTLTPEQIRADLSFKMLGVSETVTREARFNQLTALYNLAANNPNINIGLIYQEMVKAADLNLPMDQLMNDIANPAAAQAVVNPEVSAETEEAIVNQIQQNGSGGGVQIPQQ